MARRTTSVRLSASLRARRGSSRARSRSGSSRLSRIRPWFAARDVLGTDVPPIENLPNRTGVDPHENPRRTPAEQQMVSDFLMPNAASKITDTCNGSPCYDYLFSGP